MKNTNVRWWVRAGLVLPLLVLAGRQTSFAGTTSSCVDPTPPTFPDEGNEGGSTEGHIGDLSLGQWLAIDWGSLHRTPWNDDLWTWLFGDGGPEPDPGDDDPGTDGGGGSGTQPPPPDYHCCSYEGESTAAPGCGDIKHQMAAHPLELAAQGNLLIATLMPLPRFTITMVRFPRPMALPVHTTARLGLQGNWVIVAGSHPVVGGKLRFPMMKLP